MANSPPGWMRIHSGMTCVSGSACCCNERRLAGSQFTTKAASTGAALDPERRLRWAACACSRSDRSRPSSRWYAASRARPSSGCPGGNAPGLDAGAGSGRTSPRRVQGAGKTDTRKVPAAASAATPATTEASRTAAPLLPDSSLNTDMLAPVVSRFGRRGPQSTGAALGAGERCRARCVPRARRRCVRPSGVHDDLSRRKSQHLDLALREEVEPAGTDPLFRCVRLVHRALPELRLADVDLSADLSGARLRAPLMVLGMTGGTDRAGQINRDLARIAEEEGIAFGVGSMRVLLDQPELLPTFDVRPARPPRLFANLGAQQLVQRGREAAH